MDQKYILFLLNFTCLFHLLSLGVNGQDEIVHFDQNPYDSVPDWPSEYSPELEIVEPQPAIRFAHPENSFEEFGDPNHNHNGEPGRAIKFQFGGRDDHDDDDYYGGHGGGWGSSEYHYSSYPSYGWGGGYGSKGYGWKPYSKIDLLHEALDVGHSAIQLLHKKKYLKKASHTITFSKGYGSGWGWGSSGSGWGWGSSGSGGWGWGW